MPGGGRPELVSALPAQGGNGQRALSLLLDTADVLNRHSEFRAPHGDLRGALGSVLSIAGTDFPGLRSATKAVTDAVDAWRQQGGVGAGDLDVLVGAVEELCAESRLTAADSMYGRSGTWWLSRRCEWASAGLLPGG